MNEAAIILFGASVLFALITMLLTLELHKSSTKQHLRVLDMLDSQDKRISTLRRKQGEMMIELLDHKSELRAHSTKDGVQ